MLTNRTPRSTCASAEPRASRATRPDGETAFRTPRSAAARSKPFSLDRRQEPPTGGALDRHRFLLTIVSVDSVVMPEITQLLRAAAGATAAPAQSPLRVAPSHWPKFFQRTTTAKRFAEDRPSLRSGLQNPCVCKPGLGLRPMTGERKSNPAGLKPDVERISRGCPNNRTKAYPPGVRSPLRRFTTDRLRSTTKTPTITQSAAVARRPAGINCSAPQRTNARPSDIALNLAPAGMTPTACAMA